MRPLFPVFSILALSVFPLAAGTLQQADAIRTGYERDMKAWILKLRLAETPQARRAEALNRPSGLTAARRMWTTIQPNLADPWVLEPASWFLRVCHGLTEPMENGATRPAMVAEVDQVCAAVEKFHLKSKELAPMCMALVGTSNPRSLKLLEKIESQNPDKVVQGVAALGIAMLLKDLSDEPEVMRRRLTMLRKAIIESSDAEVEGISVAKMAEDELYLILSLSKGREAPDLEGTGSGGEPMALTNYKGKVVVLLFWRADSEENDAALEMASRMRERFVGKPFEVVGVNLGPKDALRKMQASGELKWPNFCDPDGKLAKQYRVGVWPMAYLLDGNRKIHFVGPMGSFVELTAAALLQETR